MSTVMTAGDGNEVTENTVVVDEETGNAGIVLRFSTWAGPRALVQFPGPGSHSCWIPLENLNVAADQSWAVPVRQPHYVSLGVTDDEIARGEDYGRYDFPNLQRER